MSRQRQQVVIGVALAAFFNVPALAQRVRVPPADGAAAARPAAERPAVERAAVERPAVVTPPPAPQPAPPQSASGGGRPAPSTQFSSTSPRTEAESSGRRGDGGGQRGGGGQGGGRRDDSSGGDQRGDRNDGGGYGGGRRDGGSKDANYAPPGAIVINPVVVYPVRVGTTQLGRTTTIGQRVVLGAPVTGEVAAPVYGPRSRPYGYSGYVAYVPETIEVVDGTPAPSMPVETRTDMPIEETREIRPASEPQAAQRSSQSLASLGSQYSFTPWYAVSEFVMAGYPFRYPEAYAVAYDKTTISPDAALPQAARDALEAGIPLVPYAAGTFGGITFHIEPVDAALYVDGIFVGLLEDFTPATAPLPLPVGPHRVEIRASGFRVERFEVIVTQGQVTPLSGILARGLP